MSWRSAHARSAGTAKWTRNIIENSSVAQGYYTIHEFAQFVLPCDAPAARCPGGSAASCADGYSGFLCAKCSESTLTVLGRDCAPCGGTSAMVMVIAVGAVIGVAGLIGALFVPPSTQAAAIWSLMVCVYALAIPLMP